VRVQTDWGNVPEWHQPIIAQPEVGVLGILVQRRRGVLHFLMQAKAEPGNINGVQLSPTVQATKSNYTRIHGGARTLFLEYFIDADRATILLDQLQSEQGSRFLGKRNRNMIVEVPESETVEAPPHFRWMTLSQLKKFLRVPNRVNMDSRSILGCVQLEAPGSCGEEGHEGPLKDLVPRRRRRDVLVSLLSDGPARHSIEEVISWFTRLKSQTSFARELCPLRSLPGWISGPREITHRDKKYFRVIGVRSSIGNREMESWDQPLIQQRQSGLIAFLVKRVGGVLHVLVQAKLEAGNFDVLELAPTVQCLTGNYHRPDWEVPFLRDLLKAKPGAVLYDVLQSEEGGRFYHEQNRNMVVEMDAAFAETPPPAYMWMTLRQIKMFVKFNNYFNIEARGLLAGWGG
jgi:oxidase EvaA